MIPVHYKRLMAETYNDLRAFLRAFVVSRYETSGVEDEKAVEGCVEALINGAFGEKAQRYYEERGEYPAHLVYDPSRPGPRIGFLRAMK